jgi:hypothetical protein
MNSQNYSEMIKNTPSSINENIEGIPIAKGSNPLQYQTNNNSHQVPPTLLLNQLKQMALQQNHQQQNNLLQMQMNSQHLVHPHISAGMNSNHLPPSTASNYNDSAYMQFQHLYNYHLQKN